MGEVLQEGGVPQSTKRQLPVVLAVDDSANNLRLIRGILAHECELQMALNGQRALELAVRDPIPDLILLDIMMPEMSGHEVCRRLKDDPRTRNIPVLFVTAMGDEGDEAVGFELGAVDYITKPINSRLLRSRVRAHLQLHRREQELEALVLERTQSLVEAHRNALLQLGRAAEFKDNETGLHIERMSSFSCLLWRELGMPLADMEDFKLAASMHDLGKIGIPDHILLKPGKLTDDEWAVMSRHPEIGASIAGKADSNLMIMVQKVALTHHEKWNGRGYPRGLKGEEIPLVGRVVALPDVFDALTSARPYKSAWSVDRAMELIRSERGEHFDPQVVDAFERVLPEVLELKRRFAE
ncbi:MAG: response regulator [Mariprofundales bacterium]|nr:response regulator [Mariprofundales bacterium]